MLAGHWVCRSSRWGRCLGSISFPLLALSGTFADAQEALRTAINADRSLLARQVVAPNEIAPLKAGPVEFAVGLSFGVEYTDNVRNVKTPRKEDFALRPQLDLNASMPVSETGRVSLGMGVGYADYLSNDDLDRLFFAPNSELAYDFSVKDFHFSIYDSFDYSYDVQSVGGLAGVSQFPRFQNTAGMRATWVPSKWSYQAGYSHFNFISDGSEFSYLDRSSEQFYARVAYAFAPATRIGMEATSSITDYNEDVQADNTSLSVGPYVEWKVTEAIGLNVRGGFTHYSFDSTLGSTNTPVRPAADSYGLDSYYANVGINHQLTAFITHGLSFTHQISPGVNQGSDVTESDNISYQTSWRLTDNTTLGTSFSYELGNESQSEKITNEKYEVFQAGLSIGYRISQQASLSASYSYIRRASKGGTSSAGSRDYFVNRVTVGLRYQF